VVEIASTVLVFVLLCVATGLGVFIGPRLPERHRTRETVELMQLTIGMLATFAAIVLGLLTASVKQDYDSAARDRQHYALDLTQLDSCLRDFGGPDSAAARQEMISYVAAVIASTWPKEPRPEGMAYPSTLHMPLVGASPVLARIMDEVGVDVSRLSGTDSYHVKVAGLCLDRYRNVTQARLGVIEDARSQLYDPFYQLLVFWLMIMFVCFGLVAPRNSLSLAIIVVSALSLSSVIFVIIDLSRPYSGFFSIPSTTMRNALNAMLAP
jgi:hypothetical protein